MMGWPKYAEGSCFGHSIVLWRAKLSDLVSSGKNSLSSQFGDSTVDADVVMLAVTVYSTKRIDDDLHFAQFLGGAELAEARIVR